LTAEQIAQIDSCLASWRQGDVVLDGNIPFVHLADLASPTTAGAEELVAEQGTDGLALVSMDVLGFVVVTQTCDLVRTCLERPYLEICPLIPVPDNDVEMIRRGRLPRYVALPGLTNDKIVADLDRVMTIEKGLLVSITHQRTKGISNDQEASILSETLGRKRTRAALPDDFVASVSSLRRRIIEKHPKDSAEGDFLRSVREIRVRPIPDWDASEIEVEFLYVFDAAKNIPKDAERKWIEPLMSRVKIGPWITAVYGRPVGLDQLSAASYLSSERLDLDHLSQEK
jgi:hypothetical protein